MQKIWKMSLIMIIAGLAFSIAILLMLWSFLQTLDPELLATLLLVTILLIPISGTVSWYLGRVESRGFLKGTESLVQVQSLINSPTTLHPPTPTRNTDVKSLIISSGSLSDTQDELEL